MDNTIVGDNVSTPSAGDDDLLDDSDGPDFSHLLGGNDLVESGDVGMLTSTITGVDPRLGPLQETAARRGLRPSCRAAPPSVPGMWPSCPLGPGPTSVAPVMRVSSRAMSTSAPSRPKGLEGPILSNPRKRRRSCREPTQPPWA